MKRLLLALLLAGLLALAGCGGSGGKSNSGGSSAPGKAICQNCTYGNECESGNCRQFNTGTWRCVPADVKPGYVCPSGQYKDSCN